MPDERPMPPQPKTVDHYTINCDDITKILRADLCHDRGITGEGIVVGIVDSGYYDHKFFDIKRTEWEQIHQTKGWNYPTLAFPPVMHTDGSYKQPDPELDRSGHGTGMTANLYAVAPRVSLRVYPVQSFILSLEAAVTQCQIISLSKATNVAGHPTFEQQYRDHLTNAHAAGKIVVHCAGNGNSRPWPITNVPQHLIKVGGVHRKQDGSLEASNYARANTGVEQNDICGLCGMQPSGAYIWLPADPNHNAAEQLAPGWVLASGTSSATPQVAGVIALMQQARVQSGLAPLTMEQAKTILRDTARVVTVGSSFDGVAAAASWCRLVDADAAVTRAAA